MVSVSVFALFWFCVVVEIEHRALSMTDKFSTPEMYPHSRVWHCKTVSAVSNSICEK